MEIEVTPVILESHLDTFMLKQHRDFISDSRLFCVFQSMPATNSTRSLPTIPDEMGARSLFVEVGSINYSMANLFLRLIRQG